MQALIASKKLTWRNFLEDSIVPVMAGTGTDTEAWRCKVVRFMIAGDNQTLFVAKIGGGLTVKQWNNFERGSPLSKAAALTLSERIQGLTTDWLWRRHWGGVPGQLREELEAAEKALISAEGRARK